MLTHVAAYSHNIMLLAFFINCFIIGCKIHLWRTKKGNRWSWRENEKATPRSISIPSSHINHNAKCKFKCASSLAAMVFSV